MHGIRYSMRDAIHHWWLKLRYGKNKCKWGEGSCKEGALTPVTLYAALPSMHS